MGEPQDEISLRELYLIFKSGLRWILGVSVGIAVLAFAVLQLQPERYQATATVRVSPLQVQGQTLQNGQLQQNMIDVNSVTQIGFDAYRTVALSHDVLASAVKATPSLPSDFGAKQLAESVTVTKVSGGGSDPLIVSQEVTSTDPKRAAALANAWANASADAARSSIGKALGGVRSTMNSQLTSLTTALTQAETQWAGFQKQDDRSSLQAQLDALDTRTTSAQEKLDELDRSVATAKAQQAMLQSVVAARSQGKPADLAAQMQALSSQGVLSPELAQQLTDVIASVPSTPGAASQDLATLVARAQLQQRTADLAGYVAERRTVGQQLDGFSKQASDLRSQLAAQQQTAQQLQRQLDSAQQAYDKVSQAAPLIDVADKLVPSMAGVFNAASVPEQPTGQRTAVLTTVAFVLTFFAMVAVGVPPSGRHRGTDARPSPRRSTGRVRRNRRSPKTGRPSPSRSRRASHHGRGSGFTYAHDGPLTPIRTEGPSMSGAQILLTGGSGVLGTALRGLLPGLHAPTHTELDLLDHEQVMDRIRAYGPDVVIHAAAYTDVAGAEREHAACWQVNVGGHAPWWRPPGRRAPDWCTSPRTTCSTATTLTTVGGTARTTRRGRCATTTP